MTDPYGGTSLRIVRDDGKTIVADGQWSGGWAVEWEGLADFLDLPIDLSTSANVLTDGSTLISSRVAEVERTATIVYAGQRDPASVRDEALAFFNPKHAFEVHVTHLGRTRWCEGELAARQCVIQPSRYPCRVSFTLLCLDPFLRGEDSHDSGMSDYVPMSGFPFVSIAQHYPTPDGGQSLHVRGFLASKRIYDGLNTVYNAGDVSTTYQIVMVAKGTIQSPTFTKDDKFVHVLDKFVTGDTLVIDFEAAPPTVTKNGEDIIAACSRDSNFVGMEMQVGANVFNYTCDNSDNRPLMDVTVRYYAKYLGV